MAWLQWIAKRPDERDETISQLLADTRRLKTEVGRLSEESLRLHSQLEAVRQTDATARTLIAALRDANASLDARCHALEEQL